MPAFMRSAAKASVPSASALVAASTTAASSADRASRSALHQRLDRGALLGGQQIAVGIQRALRGQQHAVGIHARLDQRARLHVLLRGREALLQHGGDLVVGKAVGRLDRDTRLDAAALLLRAHAEQAVGIDGEGDADARRAGSHRRNAAQLEARQAAAIGDQIALALHHVQRQRGLAVLVGGEVLRHRGRDGLVARHDALDQPAHGLDAERQRNHVEQQQVVRTAVAGELVRLDRGAERDDFVGIEVGQGLAAEELGDRAADLRHARGPADQHDALQIVRLEPRVAQRLAHRRDGARGEARRRGLELRARGFRRRTLRPASSADKVADSAADSASFAARAAVRSTALSVSLFGLEAGTATARDRRAHGRSRRRRARNRRPWR